MKLNKSQAAQLMLNMVWIPKMKGEVAAKGSGLSTKSKDNDSSWLDMFSFFGDDKRTQSEKVYRTYKKAYPVFARLCKNANFTEEAFAHRISK